TPLVLAALLALAANVVFALALPRGPDALSIAFAQSAAFAVALVGLLALAARAAAPPPPWRDVALAAGATGVMLVAVAPLRAWEPGVATVAAQAALGMAVYLAAVAAFDIAGLRSVAFETLHAWRRRL
ncbi:MAG TPA: lipopolysaccharide biosynthesis protein, partial [Beijerinckiaceae bacterium]